MSVNQGSMDHPIGFVAWIPGLNVMHNFTFNEVKKSSVAGKPKATFEHVIAGDHIATW